MTDLIALAKQAGADVWIDKVMRQIAFDPEALQAFADLIRQDEREQCIQLCEAVQCRDIIGAEPEYMDGKAMARSQCASAIRARTTT